MSPEKRSEPLQRLVFFGTPDFAVPTLRALCESGQRPVAVITQPARPVGRGRQLQDPPVARWALSEELPVVQPNSVRDRGFLQQMEDWAPDVAIVVAFGQIFSKELLEIPVRGCINLHASLVPNYRGAAPINWAMIHDEPETPAKVIEAATQLQAVWMRMIEAGRTDWDKMRAELYDAAERYNNPEDWRKQIPTTGHGIQLRGAEGVPTAGRLYYAGSLTIGESDIFLKWRTQIGTQDSLLVPEYKIGLEYQPMPYLWMDFNYGLLRVAVGLLNNLSDLAP